MEARWEAWLSENLLLGVARGDLEGPLVAAGYSASEVAAAIEAAEAHPYFRGARQIARRLGRREWLLRTLQTLRDLAPAAPPTPSGGLTSGELTSGELLRPRPWPSDATTFCREHYAPACPGFFPGAAAGWPALDWTAAKLAQRFGDQELEVQWGRSKDPAYEQRSGRYKRRVPFSRFAAALEAGPSNDVYLTANNAPANAWLLAALASELGELGEVFSPRSLGPEALSASAFLWIGPSGVVTPLHHDLTNNLFVQLSGRKRFYLASNLQPGPLGNDRHVYSPASLRSPDFERFPELARVRVHQVDLAPGDVLFLPVGWWHEVEGLSASISLTSTRFPWPNDYPRDPEPLED